jgi:hypothetical protein
LLQLSARHASFAFFSSGRSPASRAASWSRWSSSLISSQPGLDLRDGHVCPYSIGPSVDRDRDVALDPDARWLNPPMPKQLDEGDRQTLVALQRATTSRDPVQRVAALWEAIEFYVGDHSPEAQFTKEEIAGAVQGARAGLVGAKAERVGNPLRNMLNDWPIRARFEHILDAEGVPYTDEDRARIKELRTARGRGVHGGQADPSNEEIDQAVGLVSRALSTRWSRRADS